MSDDHGSVNLSRKAFLPVETGGDVLWNKPREFSEWEAWEYLFVTAAFQPHQWMLRSGENVTLVRGETRPQSVRYLRKRWGWNSDKRVHSFLHRMIEWERIRKHRETTDGNTYVVVNYDHYQKHGNGAGVTLETVRTHSGNERESSLLLHPPHAGEEVEMNAAEARVEMWAEFDRRLDASTGLTPAERQKATATVRGIIDGDTSTAWHDPTGMPVRWSDRPRLFRLALDERTANGGKLHTVLRQVVIPREYDPFPQTKSTDAKPSAPAPGSEAANVLSDRRRESPGAGRSQSRQQADGGSAQYIPSVDELKAKRDAAESQYSAWRRVVLAQLEAEPEDVQAEVRREAQDELGTNLSMLPPSARPRTLEAKALAIYGDRIGNPQPRAA